MGIFWEHTQQYCRFKMQDLLVAQVLQSESTYAVMAVLNFTRIEDSKCKGQLLGHLGGEDYKEALDLTELT